MHTVVEFEKKSSKKISKKKKSCENNIHFLEKPILSEDSFKIQKSTFKRPSKAQIHFLKVQMCAILLTTFYSESYFSTKIHSS